MRTVAIGESSEYGARLVRFLENHLSREVHIVRCTEPGQFVDLVPKEAYCVVSEEFIRELEEEYSHMILIGEREDEHTFCKYHSPAKLVEQIESYFQDDIREKMDYRGSNVTLVAIYAGGNVMSRDGRFGRGKGRRS